MNTWGNALPQERALLLTTLFVVVCALLLQLPQQLFFVQAAFLLCILFNMLTSIMSGFRRILLHPRGKFCVSPFFLLFLPAAGMIKL